MNTDKLTKEFEVDFKNCNGENFTICRDDYEGLPMPLQAFDFSDEQMQKLADRIANELSKYNFDMYDEDIDDIMDDAFWKEMEECAVHMGMVYYEDIECGED